MESRMRLSVLSIVALLAAAPLLAQSPSVLVPPRDASDGAKKAQAIGPSNPWGLSGALSIKPLAGDGNFSEEWLLGSSRVAFEIPEDEPLGKKSHIAVFANLANVASRIGSGADSLDGAIQSLISSDEGLNVGVYPYWTLPDWGKFKPSFFLSAGAKVNSYKASDSTDKKTSLLVGRFAGGFELALGSGDTPLTLTVSGVHSRFGAAAYEAVFKESRSSITSAELTTILPLGTNGTGVIFEAIGVRNAKPSFRLGLLFKAPKKDASAAPTTGEKCTDIACDLEISGETAGAPIAITVTDPPTANKTNSCNALANGGTCTISVSPGTKVTISVPTGVALSGGGCSGTTCTLTMDKKVKVTARRS
jgi:hypothetical protein